MPVEKQLQLRDGRTTTVRFAQEPSPADIEEAIGALSAKAPPASQGEGPSFVRKALAYGGALAAPLVGGAFGGIPGAVVGGGAGEGWRQWLLGEDPSLLDVGLSAGFSGIPAGIAGKYVTKPVTGALARLGEGAFLGGGYPTAHALARGELPAGGDVAAGAGLGALLGGPLGALEGRFAQRAGQLKQAADVAKAAEALPVEPRVPEWQQPPKATGAVVGGINVGDRVVLDKGPTGFFTVTDASDPKMLQVRSPDGVEGQVLRTRVKVGQPTTAARPAVRTFAVGDRVVLNDQKGFFTVTDASDPAMVTLRDEFGGVGRARRQRVLPAETAPGAAEIKPPQGKPLPPPAEAPVVPEITKEVPGKPIGTTGAGGTTGAAQQFAVTPDENLTRPIPPRKPLRDTINISLSKFPEPYRDAMRNIIQEGDGFAEQRRGTQTWDRTNALAERQRVPLDAVLKPGTILNAEETKAFKNAILWTKAEIDQAREAAAGLDYGTVPATEVLRIAGLQARFDALVKSYSGVAAEQGRALNIHRQISDILSSGDMEAIEKAVHVGKDRKRLAALFEELGKTDDPREQFNIIQKKNKEDLSFTDRYVRPFLYGNILSSLKTQERNIFGNLARLGIDVTTLPYRAAISKLSGKELAYLGEFGPAMTGMWRGASKGLKEASHIMQYGFSGRHLSKWQSEGSLRGVRVELPGGLKNPYNMIGRALDATDALFRAIGTNSELYAGAFAIAKREAKGMKNLTKGQARDYLQKRVADLVVSPPDELRTQAERYGARAVYEENPGYIAQAILSAKRHLGLPGDFIAPFVKIPAAFYRQSIQLSPFGFATKVARSGKGREQLQAAAEAAFGSTLLVPVGLLAANGALTGAAPKDEAERAAFYEAKKLPNAFFVPKVPARFADAIVALGGQRAPGGGWWVSNSIFGPLALQMSAVANMASAYNRKELSDKGLQDKVGAAVSEMGSSMFDVSFLQGLTEMASFFEDPTKWFEIAAVQVAKGLTPGSSLLRNLTQAMDNTVRDPRGVVEKIQVGLPGVSKGVPPHLTRFGEEVQRTSGSPLQRAFVVPEIERTQDDPVGLELDRLDIRIAPPTKAFEIGKRQIELTPEQATIVGKLRGKAVREALAATLASPLYAQVPEDVQRNMLKAVISRARNAVKGRIIRELMPTIQEQMKQNLGARSYGESGPR